MASHKSVSSDDSELTVRTLVEGAKLLQRDVHLHRLNKSVCSNSSSPMEEYKAIFETASSLLLSKADRASLLVSVGWEDVSMDAYAAFIGMLPFRGIQVALLSKRQSYGNLVHFKTRSGTFDMDGLTAARMGKFTVHSVFGDLPSRRFKEEIKEWQPVDITSDENDSNIVEIPFKIGGIALPMLTHNGPCEDALSHLKDLLNQKYPKGFTPIVSVGETCDALGYGQDLLDALEQDDGLLFSHLSGETYKRYDNYGTDVLFDTINGAKRGIAPPVILAVGGGVNGNCIGLIAGLTNTDFIEIPTTPMHYNDAVTSAKKAFSLVVDDRIMSKNILGAFYLPQLAFCVNEWLLTISSAAAHATVGEAAKTMNMLGIANSAVGAKDFHNILGAVEFASDFTKILAEVEGFDNLINFIENPSTLKKKKNIIKLGKRIAAIRDTSTANTNIEKALAGNQYLGKSGKVFRSAPSVASLAALDSSSESSSDSEDDQEEVRKVFLDFHLFYSSLTIMFRHEFKGFANSDGRTKAYDEEFESFI